MSYFLKSKSALTRVQAFIIAAIIVMAAIVGGSYYYWTSMPKSPVEPATVYVRART